MRVPSLLAVVGGLLALHLALVLLGFGLCVYLPIDVKPVLASLYGPLIFGVSAMRTSTDTSSSWRGPFVIGVVALVAWVQAVGLGGIQFTTGVVVRLGIYGVTGYWLVRTVRLLYRHVSSGGTELSWLYHAVLTFSALTLVGFVDLIRLLMWPGADQGIVVGAILVLGGAVVGIAVFRGVLYPERVRQAPAAELATRALRSDQDELAERLIELFEGKALFLNPRLTLADVGARLGVKPYVVSRILNRQLEQSFPVFVSRYRVQRARTLLRDTDLKMHAVALDSGFANTTSFHRTFRRVTGMTPSAYRAQEAVLQVTVRES